jgi:multicomponent Na+:H+ antiporter subunit F
MAIILTFCGLLLTAAILCCLVRMVKGPTVLDRILSFDAITICVVGLMVVLSVQWSTPYFLELILIFSLLGFLGSVAFILYLQVTLPSPGTENEHEDKHEHEAEGEGGAQA